MRVTALVYAVLVTYQRPDEVARTLKALTTQTWAPDHVIVVDNDDDDRVRDLVAGGPVPTTYLGSRRNLGGAGGFAIGMLHALAAGADWVWCAEDDGRPQEATVLASLMACAQRHGLAQVSPIVCDQDDPQRLAFPVRRGRVVRRYVAELRAEAPDVLPDVAALFNGALFRAETLEVVGVPDLRLFVSGDELEMKRRMMRSGLAFGTCLDAVYLHPHGVNDFKPILGGWLRTEYPDDPRKRFFNYRNRGYLLAQPGLRRFLPLEWLRFGWFFLVSRRDVSGLREWIRLRRLGRAEKFVRPEAPR